MARNFNPRPLAGATKLRVREFTGARISIHAPLRGRPYPVLVRADVSQFQSTPPCGGDPVWMFLIRLHWYFNPRPLAGATPSNDQFLGFGLFQSTPPCGGDVDQLWAEAVQL